ncbi:MAG: DUF3147 domain-containing protein [Candidatus Brocadiales bacterium]
MNPKYLLYFFVGGIIVSVVSYFGGVRKSLLSSFIAMMPALSIITATFIYREAGADATVSYAKGLIIFSPAWLCYIGAFILLLPRVEMWKAVVMSVFVYFAVAFLTRMAVQGLYDV